MLASFDWKRNYVKLFACLKQSIFGTHYDPCRQVNRTEGPRTENVVPYPADGLKTRKHMGEPSKYPWNDKNQEFWFPKTFKNCLKLSILGHYNIEDNFTKHNTDMANIEFEKIMEINFTGFLHHVIANVISKNGQKYWCDVMEPLNVPEFWMMAKEVIEHHEYVILPFFPLLIKKVTDESW